jgi:O-acetyl-ADP-ribose deacetylase (regulator of RNase III)
MPTELVKGDIFELDGGGEPRAYAFGSDADGTLETGIAIAFRKRWPALAEAYAARSAGGKLELGDVFTWRGTDEHGDVVVYALALQRAGKKPKVSTLERALKTLVERAAEDGVKRVKLPRIGAGKAKDGIDWTRVKRVLSDVGESTPVALVVFEQFIRSGPAEKSAAT